MMTTSATVVGETDDRGSGEKNQLLDESGGEISTIPSNISLYWTFSFIVR